MSRIASVKLKKALSDCKHAVSPRVLAFCVMVVCLVATLSVTAANLRLTYVTDSNGARQVILTSETDPAQVMNLSGIQSEEGDQVYYTAYSGNLAALNIERAFSVSITADGQEYPVKMVFGTVADALKRAGITLEGDDYTEPALDQLVSAGSTITVHRVDYTDRVETQAIPYDTEYVYTSLYFRNTGRATTVRHGAEGQQTITTRDRYVDGELENSIVVDSTTTVEPTNHVIKTYGAGAPVPECSICFRGNTAIQELLMPPGFYLMFPHQKSDITQIYGRPDILYQSASLNINDRHLPLAFPFLYPLPSGNQSAYQLN